jgi:hypothetical protein
MKEYLAKFRSRVEKHWDKNTVSPKFLPIDDSKPASLGQCAPTSQVLLDNLRADYPDNNYTLAIGQVKKNGRVVIPYHVWVVKIEESPKDNYNIDVTADQSMVLTEIIYAKINELSQQGIDYISYEQSESKRFIHSEALQRYRLLKEKYDSL